MKLMELKIRHVGITTAVQEVIKLSKLDKPLMIIMIGLPASGKSTFTHQLRDAMEKNGDEMFTIASTDDLIEETAKTLGITYDQAFAKTNRAEIEAKFLDIVKKTIDEGGSILIDRTHMSKKHRKPHLTAVQDKEFTKVAVAFEVDPKVQAARLKKRSEETGKSIPDDIIENMKKEYETPSHAEGFDEIIFVS